MPLESNEIDWIDHVNESVKLMPSNEQQYWKKRSIYRVPAYITNLNRKACQPQAVSFGPYHHGQDHLRPMKEHKHCALLHFLRRSGKPLEPFVESLREVAVDLEESYDTLDPKWKESGGEAAAGRFLELMITDGCFMLEILRTMTGEVADYASNDPIFGELGSLYVIPFIKRDIDRFLELMITDGCFMLEILRTMTGEVADYASNNSIFGELGSLYVIPFIKRDMLMLENQLPKLVLDRLVAVERDGEQEDEFTNKLILKFFSPCMKIEPMAKCLHVLDVFRKSLLLHESMPEQVQPNLGEDQARGGQHRRLQEEPLLHKNMPEQVQPNPDEMGGEDGEEIISSATELELFGIQLETSKTGSLEDISFAGGVLRLPANVVDDTTESTLLNLMTFEHFHHGAGNDTAYIIFLDDIIANEQDVALLNTRGIINSFIGSNKAVAELFASLKKDMTLDTDNSLEAVRKEVCKVLQEALEHVEG